MTTNNGQILRPDKPRLQVTRVGGMIQVRVESTVTFVNPDKLSVMSNDPGGLGTVILMDGGGVVQLPKVAAEELGSLIALAMLPE